MLAASSISIINVDDGWGIDHVEISYAIHTSATDPPGAPLMDEGVVVVDIDGNPLTDGEWSEELPETPNGYFLWTRTVTYYSDGQFSIAYVVGYSGLDGATGEPGASIIDEAEQWYLSTSNAHLVGGSWSYIEPQEIEDGKYLWGRWEFKMSDGTIRYSDAVHRSVISGLISIADGVNKKITQKIWETDIDTKISAYNSTTAAAIRDRVSTVEQDLNGISSRVSDTETALESKADGSTVTSLANTVSNNEQTASQFRQTVTSTYARLTDVDDKIENIKIGGNNLYAISDEVSGYLHETSGAIISQSSTYKEFTSDYIPVKKDEPYVIQSWCTPNSAGASWLAYQFFINNTGTPLAARVSKQGSDTGSGVEIMADGKEHLIYKVIVPENALYLRVSYRCFQDGYAMIEKASTPSEYVLNPRDIEKYTDDAVYSAKSEIKQTTDAIELAVSEKIGADEVISSINIQPEGVKISASKVDLIGNVTFTMLDSSAQSRITTVEENASDALASAVNANQAAELVNEKAKVGLGMKTNYSAFSTTDPGECYLHGYTNGLAADVDGYVYWNDVKRTVPKKMLNPNNILPYWTTIYIVLRLSSASAITGTLYMVWYNSGWKYAVTPTPSAVGGTWTWAETTDIVLGQFIEPSNEGQIVDAYLYNPPRNASHIQSTGSNSYQYAKNSVDWVSTNGAGVLTAKTILDNWAEDATQANTTINGGLITTHTIASEALMTNAIMSSNYSSGNTGSETPIGPYSNSGSFLDLSTGNLYMPNFGVDSVNGAAYINGTLFGSAGHFGSTNSYWNIETVYDYNVQPHAALVGTGSPFLQTGNWQMSDSAIATRKYTNTTDSSGLASYYKDNETNTFYDVGMKIPTNFATYNANDSSGTRFAKTFFYGRKYTGNSIPGSDTDWTYFFMVDTDGNLYENGIKLSSKYASISGVDGAYLPRTGIATFEGTLTINGNLIANASSATVLATARDLNVSLTKTSNSGEVSFNGSTDATLGVTGTLGVGNGGTGKSSWTAYGLIYASGSTTLAQISPGTADQVLLSGGSAMPTWANQSSLMVGSAQQATEDAQGNTIHNTYRALSNNSFDSLTVNGNATISGTLTATLSGSATSVSNNLKIQLNSGTTEGTNQFTYNGSTAKNINITKSNIGLSNVTNNAQVKGLASGTTQGHLVAWGSDGYTISDTGVTLSPQTISGGGVTRGIVSSLASNNDGKIVLTYADGSTSDPIEITIVASQSTSAALADALNVNGAQIGSATQPVYFDNQGKPQTANKIPKLNNSNSDSAFYAPTSAGTSGYFLQSSGSGAPTWTSITKSSIGLSNVDNTADANKNVLTATKFSSNRTIALTGDVTGSANSDGNSGWSIATTVGDNSHNHNSSTITPIAIQTYTGWIGTSSNSAANDSYYFMKMRPTTYFAQWKVRYRITATVSNHTDLAATSDVIMYGRGQSMEPEYRVFNTHYSTDHRPYYYHNFYRLNSTGYQGNCYNAIGLGLRNSDQRSVSGYERTVTVELLEVINCTCELLNTGVKWANWESATSNYVGLTEINGYDNGTIETNDALMNNYVNVNDTQTISGAKVFSATTSITNNTVSTSKATGALKVSGGVGVAGQVSSDTVMIGDAVSLVYDSTLEALCFQFV